MKYLKFFVFLGILTFTVSCGQQKRYIQYKVQSGETMSKIAEKLAMETKDLKRLNPDILNEPKANSFLVVPEKKLEDFKKKLIGKKLIESDTLSEETELTEEEKLLKELKEKFEVYEVQKGDTFFNIKQRFQVTRGELLLLNPELVEGLKVGQILKIKERELFVLTEDAYYSDEIDYSKDLKVALLLPFRAYRYQNDTLTLKEIFATNATLLNIASDFYLGAEIAVDSLRNQGVAIDLSVFDTGERKSNKIVEIISNHNLNENDVVIGPFYSEEVQTLSTNVNVPIVFPVYSQKQSDFSSINIIKTSPEKTVFREELERYIKENFDEGNIIIVGDDQYESVQNSTSLKSTLEFSTNATNIAILTPIDGYIDKTRFLDILQPNTKNWVIIATDDNIIVPDAINSLISLPEETTVKVFTFDKARVYDKIDNRKLAKIGFTYVSDEFVDETSLEAQSFTSQYLKRNKALPSFYATKGFDITYDILVRLASGNDLKTTFNQGVSTRVETKFDYRNDAFLSENKALFILEYQEDLSILKLK